MTKARPFDLFLEKTTGSILNDKYSLLYLKVKGLKSRLLIDLIRLFGTNPSGIGYTIERAEVIAKDNKYQLIDSFTLCWFYCIYTSHRISIIEIKIFPIFLNSFHYIQYFGNNSDHSIVGRSHKEALSGMGTCCSKRCEAICG